MFALFLKYRVILMYYKICYLSLSRSEKSWTQRCPGQHSVILGAIPESIQLDSALSGQHSDWPSTVSYSIQIDPALYRTAFSIQFNSSLFRTELSTRNYLFCDKEQTICSVTRNKLSVLWQGTSISDVMSILGTPTSSVL